MYAVQNYKGKDCNQCTQMVRPTINQMLKAIDLDSKLAGHYTVKQSADNHQFTAPISEPVENSAVVPPGIYPAMSGREERRASPGGQQTQQLSEVVSLQHSRGTDKAENCNKTQQISPSLPPLGGMDRRIR